MRRTRSLDPSLEDAFDRAFRALDPAHVRRGEQEWAWRTAGVPAGAPFVTLRGDEGEVLSHYAALGTHVWVDGVLHRAGQAVDTFAAEQLPVAQRARMFQAACEAFIEETCGESEDRFSFCYGFPVRPAWRLGRASLGYHFWQEVLELSRMVRDPGTAVHSLDLLVDAPWPEDVEAVHRAAGVSLGFARSRSFLTWRFDASPRARYRKLLLQREGHTVAWGVLRVREVEGTRVAVLVDEFHAPGDPEAGPALEAALDDCARSEGCALLAQACGPDDPRLVRAQRLGWRARVSPYALVGHSFLPSLTEARLARELRWTLADTDLH